MLLTSYFGRLRALEEAGLGARCVPISRHLPDTLPGIFQQRRDLTLAPTAQMVSAAKRGILPWAAYERRYREEILALQEPAQVVARLRRLAGGAEPILLCYCGPGHRCHRHLAAQWLRDHGFEVQEWEPAGTQQTLF